MLNLFRTIIWRNKRQPNLITLAAALFLAAASATAGTNATGTWSKPRPTNIPFQNVLVIMVSEDADMRQDLEELLVQGIKKDGGTKAMASIHIEVDLEHTPKTKESVIAMVQKTAADAVLVARLTGESVKKALTEIETYINIGQPVEFVGSPFVAGSPLYYPYMGNVWAVEYSFKDTPAEAFIKSDTHMQAILYDVGDNGRAVYKIVAATKIKQYHSDPNYVIATNIAEAMTKKLKRAKLVR